MRRKTIIVVLILTTIILVASTVLYTTLRPKTFSLGRNVPQESLEVSIKKKLPNHVIIEPANNEQKKLVFTQFPEKLLLGYVVPCHITGAGVPANATYYNIAYGTLQWIAMQFGFNTTKCDVEGENIFYITDNPYNWIVVFVPRRYKKKDYFDAYVFRVSPLAWKQVREETLKDFLNKNLIPLEGGAK